MIQEKDKRAFQGMSDADFFKSPHLVRLLCAVLVNVTKKKMRVTIESHTKALAYTNGSNVTINPEHPLLRPFPGRPCCNFNWPGWPRRRSHMPLRAPSIFGFPQCIEKVQIPFRRAGCAWILPAFFG